MNCGEMHRRQYSSSLAVTTKVDKLWSMHNGVALNDVALNIVKCSAIHKSYEPFAQRMLHRDFVIEKDLRRRKQMRTVVFHAIHRHFVLSPPYNRVDCFKKKKRNSHNRISNHDVKKTHNIFSCLVDARYGGSTRYEHALRSARTLTNLKNYRMSVSGPPYANNSKHVGKHNVNGGRNDIGPIECAVGSLRRLLESLPKGTTQSCHSI